MIALNAPGSGTDPLTILASQAQAEAGTANDVLMTPLRTKEAVTAIALLKSGGTLTGPVCVPLAANIGIANARNAGVLFGTSAAASTIGITGFNQTLQFYTQSQLPMQLNVFELGFASTVYHSWSSSSASSSKDLFLGRAAAATLQLGQNHASVATKQTIKAHNTVSGFGADLELCPGFGGSGAGTLRMGTTTSHLAFFGVAGVSRPSGNNDSNISETGSGSTIYQDTEFDGGLAGGSYTLGGLVSALKTLGLIG